MKIIVCLDDKNGMLFAGKRQSRDAAVCEKILELTAGCNLYMNRYSAALFAGTGGKILEKENFLECADSTDFCFVENRNLTPYWDKITQIVIFHWNRHYPSTEKFPIEKLVAQWQLTQSAEFPGNSHDKITMEVYTR